MCNSSDTMIMYVCISGTWNARSQYDFIMSLSVGGQGMMYIEDIIQHDNVQHDVAKQFMQWSCRLKQVLGS